MIAYDPIDFTVEHRLPQRLDIGAWPDRRINLGMNGTRAIRIQQKMADGDLAAKDNMWKHLLHNQGCVERLARTEVQKVYIQTVGLIRKVRGYPDCQSFGVRRARSAVCSQSVESALTLNDFCVSIENFCQLAVKTDADVRRFIGKFFHQALGGPHDKFKVCYIVAVVRANHQ